MYNKNSGVEACCIACRSPLSISRSNSSFGKLTSCRICWKRKWNNAHRDTLHKSSRKWYEKNKDRQIIYSRNYYQAHRGAIRKRERKAALRRQYKISPEEYARMEAEQGGLCYLCHQPPKKGTILCVDHCHAKGHVRKLLCFRCNIILGMLEKHGLEWVDRAKAYLSEKGELKMHHTTTVGPVLDENDKPVPGKTFHVKGLLEASGPFELVTDDEFEALVVSDVVFKRSAAGGFEYAVAFSVSEEKLAEIQAAHAEAVKAKAEADRKAAEEQAALQETQTADAASKAAYDKQRHAELIGKEQVATVAAPTTSAS